MNFNAACESKCWNLHLPAQLCVQDAGGKKKKKKKKKITDSYIDYLFF